MRISPLLEPIHARQSTGAASNQCQTPQLLAADLLLGAAAVRTGSSTADAVQLVGKTPADLASLLDKRAARTHQVDEHVHQHAPCYPPLLAQPPPDHRPEVESEQRQQPVQEAVLADALGILSHSVARTEVGQQAKLQVAETAEQSVLPVRAARLSRCRHSSLRNDLWILLRVDFTARRLR